MKKVSVNSQISTKSKEVKKMDVDLEDALQIAGAGKYQVWHCLLMVLALTTGLMEILSYGYILPTSSCDLELPDHLRGLITSIPNIGIVLTAPFWGRIADNYGRKPTLMIGCIGAGSFCFLAAFMPNLVSFAICKFFAALFLSVPSSLSFAYAGEITPSRRRDLAVLCVNGLLTVSSSLSPLLAWAVLSTNWRINIGLITFRPWRLLTIVYAVPLALTGVCVIFIKESPKFLVSKGRHKEALEILRYIYSKNTGQSQDDYNVVSLKNTRDDEGTMENNSYMEGHKEQNESAWALLKPPHLKWFSLLAFLMFGLYTSLNGLFLFATDVINKVLVESADHGTLCDILNEQNNQEGNGECSDTISQQTFIIMFVTSFVYGLITLGASITPLSKKSLLVIMYIVIGLCCLLAGIISNMVIAGMLMSALQMAALGIGPLSAYAVQLFPTNLRGTAVGAVLMFGRLGSATGANAASFMLAAACTATFYTFSAFTFLCGGLTFLLPKNKPQPPADDGLVYENTDETR